MATGTYNFVSVFLNVASVGLSTAATTWFSPWAETGFRFALHVNTQSSDHVRIKDTSQLINNISNSFQKKLKYFNGRAISAVLSIPSNFPVMFVL